MLGGLLTQTSKVILWPVFPGQICRQACQVVRVSVSVCVVFVHKSAFVCVCVWAHTYLGRLTVGNLFVSCSTPFTNDHQNGRSYFKPLIRKTMIHDTDIIAADLNYETLSKPSAQCSIQIGKFIYF